MADELPQSVPISGDDIHSNEGGWQKVKDLVAASESELYKNFSLATCAGSIAGFIIGGRLGARVAGSDHIVANQLTMYPNKMQAHREYHSAVVKGFVKNGSRWGWRAGIFAGLYSAAMTLMAEYRNKHDGLNLITAGAITGATYKMLSGVRGIIVGTVLGAFFSLPMAVAAQTMIWVIPEEIKDSVMKLELEQKEKAKNKLEPWQKNLAVTDAIIDQMEGDIDKVNENTVEPTTR
eukprot:Seg1469.2 transcript_id=Seg1469.2/GoldUCD/mRNA.D3Y31 product="Complex I assembly factor TIMMDC1 mitochondrial" protein_id=Seg1469.2/GoldUCD/D3Y31